MEYEFRPYGKMQSTMVTLTGKIYEKGEHPTYTEWKIIEVIDKKGEIHHAFGDELKLNNKQEISYSEEEVKGLILAFLPYYFKSDKQGEEVIEEWFNQIKK